MKKRSEKYYEKFRTRNIDRLKQFSKAVGLSEFSLSDFQNYFYGTSGRNILYLAARQKHPDFSSSGKLYKFNTLTPNFNQMYESMVKVEREYRMKKRTSGIMPPISLKDSSNENVDRFSYKSISEKIQTGHLSDECLILELKKRGYIVGREEVKFIKL